MKVALSFADIQRATQEFQQQVGGNRQLSAKETVLFLPTTLGQGAIRGINLRHGLGLLIYEYDLKQALIIDFSNLSTQYSFTTLTFYVSGKTTASIPEYKSKLNFAAGQTLFATIPDAATITELTVGQKITVVGLGIAPQLLLTLLEEDLNKLPLDWQQRLQNTASTPYFQPSGTTPDVAHILKLILHCPHRGAIRQLYLEAKALELIALCLSQLTHYCADVSSLDWVKPKDVDALHRAKDILLQNINNPPSLAELTQQIGINERKLQKGFQQLFGTIVFGVLHDYRMELARQLLETNQMTIGTIADAVGISHRGYFATAFKRKFGSTPREYLKRFK